MRAFELWVFSYLLNSLWQVPVVYVAGLLAVRALRGIGAVAEHRVWVCALMLESVLPACSASPFGWVWGWVREILLSHRLAGVTGGGQVSVAVSARAGFGRLHLPAEVMLAVVVVYGMAIAYFVTRLVWRWGVLSRLRRGATEVVLQGHAAVCWAKCCRRFGVEGATVAGSDEVFGPVTMGVFRRLVLLPTSMVDVLAQQDLETVMAHECVHLRRRDFLKNLLYECVALPASYHPGLWLTRERLIESREMVCDGLAAKIGGRTEYGRSLLRLASLLVKGDAVRAPYAIGIFDANTFERRLMRLTERPGQVEGVRRVLTLAACVVFGVGTCGSALALRMHVDAATAGKGAKAEKDRTSSVKVPAGVMAGSILTQVNPVYPEAAKKAKIQGSVVVHAVVGKDGTVEQLHVISGPAELQRATLDAVRQWTYEPYLLNGEPVEVETTVQVTYSLEP